VKIRIKEILEEIGVNVEMEEARMVKAEKEEGWQW